MKYSLNLLKHFISIDDSVENIWNNFTLKTVEVEEIIKRKIDDKIVIWKIESVQKHPDADKLNICMVNCGSKWTFQIVCGWENVKEWIYVPVALAGTVFEKVWITIEPRKMRWVESNWMICSKWELDIPEDLDTHRIWDMGQDLDDLSDNDLWTSLNVKYPRLESAVIDVDNKWLTNRPDLTWHFGMAVDMYAMYGDDKIWHNTVKTYFDTFKNSNIFDMLNNKEKTKIWLKPECEKLNSYILFELNNVSVKPSTFFTRLNMLDLWSNPISNWVDFSNLFMNIAGQPVHFFDADKVKWNIIIRYAKDGEKFVDLFEKEHSLVSTDMVIADDEKVLALAWVVGWLDSWISNSTKNILVEIANFDPVCIRKTWIRLWLRTDAELRYEKNISPSFSMYVLILFLDLLKYYSKDLWEYQMWWLSYYSKMTTLSFFQNTITLDYDALQRFIFGEKVDWFVDTAKNILARLGFGLDGDKVSVPFWRSPDDINIVQDIYEEVARIYWYDNIPTKSMQSEISLPETSVLTNLSRDMEDIFVKYFGFDQVETYPWVDKKSLDLFGVDTNNLYMIKNPIDTDKPYMRDDMDYVMINYIAKNSKFFDEFKIFDAGRVWSKKWDIDIDSKFADEFVWEKFQFSAMYYQKSCKTWDQDLLLIAKWNVDRVFANLWLSGEVSYETTSRKWYHPNKQWNIMYNGSLVGFIWTVHPLILKNYKLPETCNLVYLSLDLPEISKLLESNTFVSEGYETLQDQIVWRDLCFVVDENVNYGTVLDVAKNINWVSDVEVFDLYKGQNLPEWKKSIAFKIKIKWENMQTEEINAIMDKVIRKVEATWAKLRE